MKQIISYLNFDGNCGEAMTFYAKCLGADLQIMPFSQAPCEFPGDMKDRVIHARLSKGAAVLMASDTMPGMPFQQGNNFTINIDCESAGEIYRVFDALVENGKVIMPLRQTFWAARFGMLKDQFGVQWMFNLEQPKPA